MDENRKIKVGMLQINNSFSNQSYFPYSVGFLQAYAQRYLEHPDNFEFLPPIYSRIPIKVAVEKLFGADILFFSAYVWNMRLSLKIAEEIKKLRPEVVIVFGGPHVPNNIKPFLKANTFVNIACHGEGEIPVLNILENYFTKDWSRVASISYLDEKGGLVQNNMCQRIYDLNTIPSPYLEGVFDPLIKATPDVEWLVMLETNRGCPFSCTFCDWGSTTHRKVYSYDIDRVFKEIDWISRQKFEFVFCCDANFGMLSRDIDIVHYVAENKKKYGYPIAFSVQNTKNLTDRSYNVQKVLAQTGLSKGVNLAMQSLNKPTLKSIKRDNISINSFQELQRRYTIDGVETYTDLILGLPDETYETFVDGISTIIENGQHNRIQFNNLCILPNTDMGDECYQKKYGIVTQKTRIINNHGKLDYTEEVYEIQQLVIGTSAMHKDDWVTARTFGWMTGLLHFDKLMQIPLIVLHKTLFVRFKELIGIFMDKDVTSPILSGIRSFFIEKAIDIQNGGTEYCESKEWLNIWWPADELTLIKLCIGNKLDVFYEEAVQAIKLFLKKNKMDIQDDILHKSILLNRSLLKMPFNDSDLDLVVSHNIWEIYQGAIKGTSVHLEKGNFKYRIDRTSSKWSSWDDWCREVVWYGHRRGAYFYNCKPLDSLKR